jgi:ABC-2 type transport system permease protein
MIFRPPGTPAVLALLARSALLRVLRAARILRARAQRPGARGATARKGSGPMVVLLLVMLPLMALQSLVVSNQTVYQLAQATGRAPAFADADRADPDRADADPDEDQALQASATILLAGPYAALPPARDRAASGCAVLIAVLVLVLLAASIGNPDLGRAEWTLPWLLTFPVATRSIVVARSLEHGLVSFFPWLTCFPLLWQTLRATGTAGALPLAAAATLCTALLAGTVRMAAETWLRQRLSLQRVRSVQGACTLLAFAGMAFVFVACLRMRAPAWFTGFVRAAPGWIVWTPLSWPAAIARHGAGALLAGALFCGAACVLLAAGTTRLLQRGTMRSGGVDPGARGQHRWARASILQGVLGKDLRLLLRDRNFLVQTLLVPLLMIGLQLWLNPGVAQATTGGGTTAAILAYAVGAFALTGGCFQVLSGEGRALWMLYTLPVDLGEVLRRKVRLWAMVALGYAGVALLVTLPGRGWSWAALSDVVFVLAGVWIAAHLAAGIATLGTNPAADYVPRQLKARYAYLYMFLSGTYVLGLHSGDLAPRAAMLLVFATLGYAVWQRMRDRIPWLLDPVDEAAPAISLYDAGTALTVFFIAQYVPLALLRGTAATPAFGEQMLAFTIAGGVTLGLFGVIFVVRGIDVATALGFRAASAARASRHLLAGACTGALLAAAGVAYGHLLRVPVAEPPPGQGRTGLLLITVVGAPLVEEVLFRGLLFQGLARSVAPALAAVWSASLFAALHPLAAWPPVFLLGLATAAIFRRTRFLPAAMAVHAVYNLGVVLMG